MFRFCDTLIEIVGHSRFKATIKTYPNIKKLWLKFFSLYSSPFWYIFYWDQEIWRLKFAGFNISKILTPKLGDENRPSDLKKNFSHSFLVEEMDFICVLYPKLSSFSTSVSQICNILSHLLMLKLSKQRYTSKIAVALLSNDASTLF